MIPSHNPLQGMDAPNVNDACEPGEHEIGRDDRGMRVCVKCRLATQTLDTHLDHLG